MIVLIGKSCSGKDRISKELIKNHGYKSIVRYTTRPIRKGEKQEITYHYISEDDFNQKIKDGFFAEWKAYNTEFGIWYYGTAYEDLDNTDGKSIIILPPDRCKEVLDNIHGEHIVLYIYANNLTIKNRLNKRGDSKEEALRRMAQDNEDFKGAEMLANRIIYNNEGTDIEEVVNKILVHKESRSTPLCL